MGGDSPTDIIPEEMLDPKRLGDVIHLLEKVPVAGYYKVRALQGWARTVGVKISASQFAAVRRSGTDRAPTGAA